eukprot:ctg_1032.g233
MPALHRHGGAPADRRGRARGRTATAPSARATVRSTPRRQSPVPNCGDRAPVAPDVAATHGFGGVARGGAEDLLGVHADAREGIADDGRRHEGHPGFVGGEPNIERVAHVDGAQRAERPRHEGMRSLDGGCSGACGSGRVGSTGRGRPGVQELVCGAGHGRQHGAGVRGFGRRRPGRIHHRVFGRRGAGRGGGTQIRYRHAHHIGCGGASAACQHGGHGGRASMTHHERQQQRAIRAR